MQAQSPCNKIVAISLLIILWRI